MHKKDPAQIVKEFHRLQSRQIIAIAITLFSVMLCAVLYKRPGVLGDFSKGTLFGAQVVAIASFLVYSSVNWRCPSCGKMLGPDIHRRGCKKCGVRLR